MWSKSTFRSKLFWVNFITLAISALTMLVGQDWVDPKIVAYITGLAIPVLNIILRQITTQPVHLVGGPRFVQPPARPPIDIRRP